MRLLAAFLTSLTLLGFAGAAAANCPWMNGNSSQSTADTKEQIDLPGRTS